jgi:gamma-glutamyltranspeptidase/glutathione hydrolase
VSHGSDADVIRSPDELECESRLGAATIATLRAPGRAVRQVGRRDAGGALVISADGERGLLAGVADLRQNGVVLGG